MVGSNVKVPCEIYDQDTHESVFFEHTPHIRIVSLDASGPTTETVYRKQYSKFSTFPKGYSLIIENVARHSGFMVSSGVFQVLDPSTVHTEQFKEKFYRESEPTRQITTISINTQRGSLTFTTLWSRKRTLLKSPLFLT